MYIGPEVEKRGDSEEGKRKDESDNEKLGGAGSMSQKVDGVGGYVDSRSRLPFVDRSCAQVLKPSVLLSKGRRSLQHVLRPMAVLVCSRAEGLPVSQALSQLAFRSHQLRPPVIFTESIH